jgi:amino acid transporter
MPLYGVVADEGHGHIVTAVLLAMVAMLLTSVSYGRMARVYPSAGSAYSYVSAEFGAGAGYIVGWMILLDYLLNPLICTVWCSSAAANLIPRINVHTWSFFFAILFTMLNLRGVTTSARVNQWLAIVMGGVVAWMLFCMVQYVLRTQPHVSSFLTTPFYDPATFSWHRVWAATSVAALTYIGFDSISTLSEEAIDPERNILRATVLTCLITGLIAATEVYIAQLVWPSTERFPDLNTAYAYVAGRAGGPMLFHLTNATLLLATIGSGVGTQLSAARLLYGMGRDNAIPRRYFGVIDPASRVPRNNVLLIGALALCGSLVISFQLGAELLNFGAFIAFMGVNASAAVHYFVRGTNRGWSYLVLPVAGFLICLYSWINLSWPAKIAGLAWLAVGILYGRIRAAVRNARPAPIE